MTGWRHHVNEFSERIAVREAYPGSEFLHGNGDVWIVPMSPVSADADDIPRLLADLDAGQVVRINEAGRLAHSPVCLDNGHLPPWSGPLPRRKFLIALEFPNKAFGFAGPVHPRARIGPRLLGQSGLVPSMDELRYVGHPHLSGVRGDSWACPLPPHETQWTWKPGAVLEYLDQVAIWLFKTEVWAASQLPPLRDGVWLGDAAGHNPTDVLGHPPLAACRCGSGAPYGECHRNSDIGQWIRLRKTSDDAIE